ncbi:hypothetical protein B0O99DRAFT_510832 [Bisporella sp. PMI_857]|nr:hypothetical protein B0O99DRAFT_510832 [Bisporella sp. PMI_857]
MGATALNDPANASSKPPILLNRSGGFKVGGKVIDSPFVPNQTLHCDHGYMEYFIPQRPRRSSIVMWHSASTQAWQNRWDGGEGFKDLYLRRRYPVFLWDGPRIGRANWACERTSYAPDYRDKSNFVAWNFGPVYPNFWPGVQFPTESAEAWNQATSNRYVEYDTRANVELETDAAAIAADEGKLGDSIVYLTNSAGGLRALMTATKSNTTNIKAIVMYEIVGWIFPENANVTAGPGGFGPFLIPEEQFKKLAEVKAIQFVWGDNRNDTYPDVQLSRYAAELINGYGGNAKVLKLGEVPGLSGNTHSAFADLNNEKVADVLDGFLRRNKLTGYASPDDGVE